MTAPGKLYSEALKRHAAEPVGYRDEIGATHEHEVFNPLCGDRITLQLRLQEGTIAAAAFHGEACAVCLASASLLCATMPGRTFGEFTLWHKQLEQALRSNGDSDGLAMLEPLLGVRAFPSRVQCAMLPWDAALAALAALGSE